jgi:protein arginine kinase activator
MKGRDCPGAAEVEVVRAVEGRSETVSLCPACARRAGADAVIGEIVHELLTTQVGDRAADLRGLICPVCDLSFAGFRAVGRLGCPHDYEVFAGPMPDLVQQAHGASRHVGKSPTGGSAARRREEGHDRLLLRAQLRQAASAEDYERAAQLRDRLKRPGDLPRLGPDLTR